jgi:hypothetical protein
MVRTVAVFLSALLLAACGTSPSPKAVPVYFQNTSSTTVSASVLGDGTTRAPTPTGLETVQIRDLGGPIVCGVPTVAPFTTVLCGDATTRFDLDQELQVNVDAVTFFVHLAENPPHSGRATVAYP